MPTSTSSPGQDRRTGRGASPRSSRRRARRAVVLALVALAPVVATAACSAADAPPSVASLPTAPTATSSGTAAQGATDAPSTPAASTTPAAPSPDQSTPPGGHPQFRLDDTDERRTALVNAYSQCLLDHGATKDEGRASRAGAAAAAGATGTPLIAVADPVPAAASAACVDVLPLMPPEVEAATNPDFHDQSIAYVACMKDQGLWVQLLNNADLSWTYVADHPVPTNSEQIEHDCLLKAFS